VRILTALLVTVVVATAASCSGSDSAPDADTGASTSITQAVEGSEGDLARHDAALATIDEITAILDDPGAFGTEEEVADLIATHAVPGALMDDAVFGAVDYRTGFYNTLYGGAMDAEIDVYHRSVSEDGSQGVILWRWHGTNAAGNPFDLPGISIEEFDEQGRVTYELVTYPYPDEYVEEAVFGAGTRIAATETPASPQAWDPILRTTKASTTPELATCPEGTDPDAAGTGEDHPTKAPLANQGAAFDTATGRIVYVDGSGETWTFDVCTNTWMNMDADDTEWQRPTDQRFDADGDLRYPPGNLVYDVDSDVTIALGLLGVYDAEASTWTAQSRPYGLGGDVGHWGAIYDPVSGLVIAAGAFGDQAANEGLAIHAYDVESDAWTSVGTVSSDEAWLFLVGYSHTTDELIFHGPRVSDDDPNSGAMTVLMDPRIGSSRSIADTEWDVFAPWGYWYPYVAGVDGAVVVDTSTDWPRGTGDLCTFDPRTRSWDDCGIDTSAGPRRSIEMASKVYDPLNDRLVVIYADGDVWAADTETGEWTELTTTGR
jgi:hypothetical protein